MRCARSCVPSPRTLGFVAGIRTHGQVGALREVWEPLARALADLDATGQDAIVDAGRLGRGRLPRAAAGNRRPDS